MSLPTLDEIVTALNTTIDDPCGGQIFGWLTRDEAKAIILADRKRVAEACAKVAETYISPIICAKCGYRRDEFVFNEQIALLIRALDIGAKNQPPSS